MPLFRSKAEDKVREAGYDPARLPPGQYFTEKWPVLHAGEVPDVDLATWTLEVSGEVEQPVTLSFAELRELPATEVTTNVPLAALEDENALIVYEADGEPLTPDHGYPVRLFIPTKYFWKSAKWLRGIELSAVDKPGFWERYGYNNNADFWQEQRYEF
jgi:DMSO/TMAO reductase YedYZ molybdopterin-dependent catalytic subunit